MPYPLDGPADQGKWKDTMKLCFVIMPIGSGDAYDVHLNRYASIIKPAVEGYQRGGSRVYDAVRADFITKTGSINKSVIQHIYSADLVIADLTDLNPNVFYELGVRHALRNGTILVALEGTKLPFDVGDLRAVFYKDRVGAEKDAVPEIQRLIHALAEAESPDDSPVFAVLPALREPQTRELARLSAENETLRTKLTELEDALPKPDLKQLAEQMEKTTYMLLIKFDYHGPEHDCETIDLLSLFLSAAPSLLIENSVESVQRAFLDTSPRVREYRQAGKNMYAVELNVGLGDIIIGELQNRGLIEPSLKKRSLKDHHQYWKLTRLGAQLYRNRSTSGASKEAHKR